MIGPISRQKWGAIWASILLIVLLSGFVVAVPPGTAASTGCAGRSVNIRHYGQGTGVQVTDQWCDPGAGALRLRVWALSEKIVVQADGVAIHHTVTPSSDTPEFLVDVVVPPNTHLLTLTYDRLDGTIPFEGLWYLVHEYVWGPATVTIHLHPESRIVEFGDPAYGTLLNPYTLQYSIPDGKGIGAYIVYTTGTVPDLYDTITTPHIQLKMPSVYEAYQDAVTSMLENVYALFSQYSGQDVNQLAGQEHYQYFFDGKWGGRTIRGGPSWVASRYIPFAGLSHNLWYIPLVSLGFHEFGNGWWLLLHKDYWTITMPWWLDSEGHSGFLRSQAELDLGYCVDAQREHEGHYQDYLRCKDAEPPHNRCGTLVEILLVSLQEKYGWSLLQAVYAGIRDGTLDLSGLTERQKDDRLILFMSQQVGENLILFFEDHGIPASASVQDQLRDLPVADVPIISRLRCRPQMLHVTPTTLEFSALTGPVGPKPQTLYVGAPVSWTTTISPTVSWLSVTRGTGTRFDVLTARVSSADLPAGVYSSSVVISSTHPVSNTPGLVPVKLTVRTLSGRLLLPVVTRGSHVESPKHR
jgi:hypothetical protein